MIEQTEAARALARQYFYLFLIRGFREINTDQELRPSDYLEAMAYPLQQVVRSDLRRLIINIAPRHLKSFCASVALPAWILGHNQAAKIIVVSYSAVLAKDLTRQYRRLISSEFYRSCFPAVKASQSTDMETHLSAGGYRMAASLDGSLTGRGGDLIIIDDPQNASDMGAPAERDRFKTVYDDALYSRLDNKQTGGIVLVTQRLHEDDATAHLLSKADSWHHLKLPAIAERPEEIPIGPGRAWPRHQGDLLAPHRETAELLEQIRSDIGPSNFSAQYLQEPVHATGAMFRIERIQRYKELPDREKFEHIVQSWDTAYTPEARSYYSVCTTWGYCRNQWYLLDAYRAKLEFPELKAEVVRRRLSFQAARVIIEWAGSGLSLLQQLIQESRFLGNSPWAAYRPRLDKISRANGVLGKIEEGRVLLPEQSPWLPDFLNELWAFPNGCHDDQVDSMVQFIDYMGSVRGYLDGRRPYDGYDRPNYM